MRISLPFQRISATQAPASTPGLFALAALLTVGFAPPPQEPEKPPTIKEKATKVEFLIDMPTPGTPVTPDETLQLVGIAVREKTIFAVDVYAYGIYVEPYGAQAALRETWGESTEKQLSKSDEYFHDALHGNFTKSLRMVFARKVDGEDVQKAFGSDLPPRIERAVREQELPDPAEAFTQFQTFFDVDKLTKGAEIVLTWHADGRLSTKVLGEEQPDLLAPALGWAIFDLFLGDNPLESSKRKKLAARMPTILDLELPPRPETPPKTPPREGR